VNFRFAEVMSHDLPAEGFDCIASLATLHHLPLREILLKMKAALNPGEFLLILDLFEPKRNLGKRPAFSIVLSLTALAIPLSVSLD